MILTELGETCEERGWLPISSLTECKASTGYFQTYYPSYVFGEVEDEYDFPKGCYVSTYDIPPEGYFNTNESGASDSDSRALCTTAGGKNS